MNKMTTRVFMSGNSQAVRIPQIFQLQADQVYISKTPDGALLIRPINKERGTQLLEILNTFDPEFIELLENDSDRHIQPQEREDLEDL